MSRPDFWGDKARAQGVIKDIASLKDALDEKGKYDKGNALMTILAGAGGDDAEDFAEMLHRMYSAYMEKRGWGTFLVHKNENDRGGYRNITFEIQGKGAYGTLKHESGVHRLVRMSPFNAKQLRHTSFALVEVVPKLALSRDMDIPPEELRFEFSRSSGPGGQNVNKRETAVRVVHIPTNLSAHAENERSQAQNKERAVEILRGKLYKKREEDRKREAEGMQVSKTMEIEWGNQIRSYVLHPYKMVKDHRTDTEVRDAVAVLEEGAIEPFLEAEQKMLQ